MELDPLVGLTDDSKPLRSKLLANEKLRTRYLQYIRDIAKDSLDWSQVGPKVEQTRRLLGDEVKRDTRKLFTTDDFFAATSTDAPKSGQASRSIRNFTDQRAKYLLNHEAIKALPSGLIPLALSEATVRPPRVNVADLSPGQSDLTISEVMASNSSTIADPQGDHDDWIELYNGSDQTIDLTGYFLSDDPKHAHKWAFPDGTKIEPKQFLLIWADEDGKDSPGLHANFKLSQKGEQVFVTTKDAVVSQLEFPKLEADSSFGSADGKETTLRPSPGAANAAD